MLVMLSMLVYFCFLEQLLVCVTSFEAVSNLGLNNYSTSFLATYSGEEINNLGAGLIVLQVGQMGSGALVISLPFSCVLGLLAAITASNLGRQ